MDTFTDAMIQAFRAVETVQRRAVLTHAVRRPHETAQALQALARLLDRLVDVHRALSREVDQLTDDQPPSLREIHYNLFVLLHYSANEAGRFSRYVGMASDLFEDMATHHRAGSGRQ